MAIDWMEVAKIGAAVGPAIASSGGGSQRNPYDSPELQLGLEEQRRRMEQSRPVYDSLVSMAYGLTPTRYRGAAPAFTGTGGVPSASLPPGSPVPRQPSRTTTPQQDAPSSGGGWRRAAGIAATAAQPILNALKGGKKERKPGETAAQAGGAGPYDSNPAPEMDFTYYDQQVADSLRPRTPSVTTTENYRMDINVEGRNEPVGVSVMPGGANGADMAMDDDGNFYVLVDGVWRPYA